MDIADILKNKHIPEEPVDCTAIKEYVLAQYKVKPQVLSSPRHLTIVVPNAALAGTLRLTMNQLQEATGVTKKIYIRIS